jgi:hypothetical protein
MIAVFGPRTALSAADSPKTAIMTPADSDHGVAPFSRSIQGSRETYQTRSADRSE